MKKKIEWIVKDVEGVLKDGTPFKLKCTYWSKDVGVEMIYPYTGKRSALHMMYMIPRTFHDNDLWRCRAYMLAETIVAEERLKEIVNKSRTAEMELAISKLVGVLKFRLNKSVESTWGLVTNSYR